MTTRHYVNVITCGLHEPHGDVVVIGLFGPRGGTKALETITRRAAIALRDELSNIISQTDGEEDASA